MGATVHTTLEVGVTTRELETLGRTLDRYGEKVERIVQSFREIGQGVPSGGGGAAPPSGGRGGGPEPPPLPMEALQPGGWLDPRDATMTRRGRPSFGRRLVGSIATGGATYRWGQSATTYAAAGAEEMAAAAAGFASGDFGAAGQGAIAAYYGRERAERGAAYGATTGAAGTAAQGVGAALMLVNPLAGVATLIAGTLLSTAGDIGRRIGDAQSAVLEARESGAIGKLQRHMQLRGRVAESRADVLAVGGNYANDAALAGIADDYGISPADMAQREAAFARAGGAGFSARELASLERGRGLSAQTVGGFMRTLRRGMGGGAAFGPEDPALVRALGSRPFAREKTLFRDVIRNALGGEMDEAALPEYLGQVASTHQMLYGRGVTVDPVNLDRERAGLNRAGFTMQQAGQVQQTMMGQSGGLLDQLRDAIMPGQTANNLALGKLIRQHGSVRGAMAALQRMRREGTVGDFYASVVRDIQDPELQAAAASQFTNMDPQAAKALASYTAAEETAGAGTVKSTAAAAADKLDDMGKDRGPLTLQAQLDAMEFLGKGFPDLAEATRMSLDIMVRAIEDAARTLPAAFDRLLDMADRYAGEAVDKEARKRLAEGLAGNPKWDPNSPQAMMP